MRAAGRRARAAAAGHIIAILVGPHALLQQPPQLGHLAVPGRPPQLLSAARHACQPPPKFVGERTKLLHYLGNNLCYAPP